MADKHVNVRVVAAQRVHYDQTLAFTVEDWERFKKLSERDARDELVDRLDLRNVVDADDLEDDFEAEVVDITNKPVKPADSYQGEC